jgi:AsmA protein
MPRRVVLLLSVLALALLGTAVVPWTLSSTGLATSVSRQLKESYGLDLQVAGRSTFALLPIPRVKFEDMRLAMADGRLVVDRGTLRGELRLLPLLRGRVELAEAALSGSRILLPALERKLDPEVWLGALQWAAADKSPIRRLILTQTSIETPTEAIRDVNLVINWPDRKAALNVAGVIGWRGEQITVAVDRLSPALLASGRPAPFELSLAAPSGRATLLGDAQIGTDPRVTGHSSIEITSVRDLTRWSGLDLPLGSALWEVSIEGDFSADRRRLTWPSVTATIGPDQLEGTLALRFDGGRPIVTGTLAADSVDLSNFFAAFSQARTAAGLWSNEDAAIDAATGGDLDLRLSANEARIGRLTLGDMAASVIVRPGRIEASLGRASLNKGTFKGRLSLAATDDDTELKAHGTFDNVDTAGFLSDLGQGHWLSGRAQGQFSLETHGATVAELVRRSQGRTTMTIKQGEVIGVSLNEALKRVEKRPLAASLDWKGGRTSFDQVHLALNVNDGLGEIADGSLTAPTLRAALRGRVSLFDRWLSVRAAVDPATAGTVPSPVIEFDVTGGWDNVAVVPDARSLIERSGAAKPLFGSERILPASQPAAPLATAQ